MSRRFPRRFRLNATRVARSCHAFRTSAVSGDNVSSIRLPGASGVHPKSPTEAEPRLARDLVPNRAGMRIAYVVASARECLHDTSRRLVSPAELAGSWPDVNHHP
jgi:hypothetical protein